IEVAWPTVGSELARTGDCPKPPSEFAAFGVVCSNKSTNTVVTTRRADDYLVFHHQGGAGRTIIAVPVCISNVPQQISRARVQAQQVGVIGLAVNAIMPHADATADVARSIIYQALTDRPRIVPYRPPGLRIKSENVICRSDKHHSIHDDRRDFQPIGIVSMKY